MTDGHALDVRGARFHIAALVLALAICGAMVGALAVSLMPSGKPDPGIICTSYTATPFVPGWQRSEEKSKTVHCNEWRLITSK